jgi:hypothetical protein
MLVYQDTWLRNRRAKGDSAPVVREGRRMRWLDTVTAELDSAPEHRHRLRAALALTIGIDSMTIMEDVVRLDDDEALATLRWAATTLFRAAVHPQ